MRAFIALELPEEFADDVSGVARTLARSVSGRFMRRETYHLTLAFLGEIDETTSRDAIAATGAACAGALPVELRVQGLGKFGRPSDATLWLGISPETGLPELARAVRDELSARAVAYDDKPFAPHVTLARRARLPQGPLPELAFPLPAEASRVTLFRSILSSDGATYKPLYTVELVRSHRGQ